MTNDLARGGTFADFVTIEICVDSVESGMAAQRGGAHRIELCSGLVEGGTTPSSGLISTVRRCISIPVYVMIRPRNGDFLYGPEDFEIMKQDVLTAKQLGADGVVLGILKKDGRVDVEQTALLVQLARPLQVTFHRAFDMSRDFSESLEALIAANVDRVLTSGSEQKVEDALPTVALLVKKAAGRISIMAGGGITEHNAGHVIEATGVRELHASATVSVASVMKHRNEKIAMGAVRGREYQRPVVSEEKVRHLVMAVVNANRHNRKRT